MPRREKKENKKKLKEIKQKIKKKGDEKIGGTEKKVVNGRKMRKRTVTSRSRNFLRHCPM